MISILESQGGASAVTRMPRTFQVRVGDEPVVLLVARDENRLLGVVANRLTPAVDRVISQAQAGVNAEDGRYRRSGALESALGAGFVYLSFEYTEVLSSDARLMRLMKSTLVSMLLGPERAGTVELLTAGGAL